LTKSIRPRGEDVRAYILQHIEQPGIAVRVADHFKITRQAAGRHLQRLTEEGSLIPTGNTRNRAYKLAAQEVKMLRYDITPDLEEDFVWRTDVSPYLGNLPNNVLEMWHWGFTEMFNNAIDHSGGSRIVVKIWKTAADTTIAIEDNGVGIFAKIQAALNLEDERQAILELSKGKLTTDATHHSGQGIFFTSRMVNQFDILSGGVRLSHVIGQDFDWVIALDSVNGTTVYMKIDNHTARTSKKTLAKFSVGDTYGFNKTIVPVRLAKYGNDQLVSRSQAKRLLSRVELFSQVLFDFTDVEMIGQAFADEIFRVFQNAHPDMQLFPTNANAEIREMISSTQKMLRLQERSQASIDRQG